MKERFCEIVYVMAGHRAKIVRAEKVYESPMYLWSVLHHSSTGSILKKVSIEV